MNSPQFAPSEGQAQVHALGPLAPLGAFPQFVLVLLVPRPDGRTDKLPLDPRTGVPSDAHNPAVWLDYDTARAIATAWGSTFTVGFVLTAADPFWCLDIDGCRTPSGWSPRALEICAALPGAVIEVSQSGNGLHIWGRGNVPPHSTKNIPERLELYDSLRFIALGQPGATGEMAEVCPGIAAVAARWFPPRVAGGVLPVDGPRSDWRGPTDDDDLIRRALMSRSAAGAFGGKASFADLWHADEAALGRAYPADSTSQEPYDRSSADAALAQHLAFWTGCDVARIERLMRRPDCALKRDKWDREDYLPRTIANACRMQRDVLQDKPPVTATAVSAVPVMTQAEGNRFLAVAEQAELFKGCVYVLDEHRVLCPGGKLLKPDQFKAYFGGYTFTMDNRNERTTRDAFEAFTQSQVLNAPKVDGTCFKPALPYGEILISEGRSRVNTWHPPQVRRKPGDAGPFLRHLAKLFPVEDDRQKLLYYLAGMVQSVGHKFQWAPLLIGVEGNGKTFLSSCVAAALGTRYTHWPKASKLGAQFNKWMFGKVAYFVEDVYVKDADVLEELKPLITGERIEVEGKGVDQRTDEICGNFIFNSNRRDALRKTGNDRRYMVLWCAQQSAEDLASDGMTPDYFKDLYSWASARDGYAIVAEFLHTFPIPPVFGLQWLTGRAPRTSSTDAAIEATRNGVERAVMQAIDEGRPGFAGGWVSSIMLRKLLEALPRHLDALNCQQADMLAALGYVRHPALPGQRPGQVDNVVLPDGAKPVLFVKQGHPAADIQKRAEVGRAYSAAQAAAQ